MPFAHRTELAGDDLRNIAFQIGVESGRPLAADQVVDDLFDCCERLAQLSPFSQMGTAMDELGSGIRLLGHRRWVIIFQYVDDGVLILRIVDGSQDYMSWTFD